MKTGRHVLYRWKLWIKVIPSPPYYSGIPYTNYSVLARAAGFNSLYVAGIPVYDGELAVLPLSLIPMQERQRSPIQSEIYVGAPAVSLAGPRS